MSEPLDFIPFIVEAFASNGLLKNEIDYLYEKDKYRYYTLAVESEYYNHPSIIQGNIENENRARRFLGILLASKQDEDLQRKIMNIAQKGWYSAYSYVEKNNIIDIADYVVKKVSPKSL